MSNQRIKIPRASDRSIVDAFKELGETYGVSSAHISALGFSNLGEVNIGGNASGDLAALLELKSAVIDGMSLQIRGLGISYSRGGQYQPEQKSPIFDEIVLSYNQQGNLSNTEKMQIVAFINKKLKAFDPGRLAGRGVSEEQNQMIAIHESTLERLELLNEDLVRQSSAFRENLEVQYADKVTKLEEANLQQKAILEEDYKEKSVSLKEKEKLLEEKIKTIDDRDNTHVRREIRDRMLEDVKTRISNFGVSSNTERKRKPVFFGMLTLVVILLTLLLYSGLEAKMAITGTDKLPMYWLWGRFTLYSLGLVGTILYYIKWENKWAEQHSSSEFQLQQFYIDVNRANWIIESCLEWRKETQSTLPKTLIEGISRNLFVKEQDETEKVIHPADQLASALMGRASKLKLRLGENELEFDKPGKIPNKPLRVRPVSETDT
ncbi:hypothetical protein Gbem_0422 [Citrifermentans bemidjiense Bem]|uniref:Uncharacterized protein n=1 Tax=Citrifermentans bemidjiense (strain ATCC BAA-1014 / DSM 16622 / JCM 12645 / Bem) TaxID=404380 RepID=B5EBI2_CITBB|nr:hypothetical protein [Citrifermentans bemidjiense]ACH37451.1 hypothetical protein Gbem_0422 [Citrifermentans bemidjiense Bem]